jgi:hypothetical protein
MFQSPLFIDNHSDIKTQRLTYYNAYIDEILFENDQVIYFNDIYFEEISTNPYYFRDFNHLNTKPARYQA